MEFKNFLTPIQNIYTQMKSATNSLNNSSNNNITNTNNSSNNNKNKKSIINNNNNNNNSGSNNIDLNNYSQQDQLEDKHENSSNKFIPSPFQSQYDQQQQQSNNKLNNHLDNNNDYPITSKKNNKLSQQQSNHYNNNNYGDNNIVSNSGNDQILPLQPISTSTTQKSKLKNNTDSSSPPLSNNNKSYYSDDYDNTINYNTYGDNSYIQPYGNNPLYSSSSNISSSTSSSSSSKKNNNSIPSNNMSGIKNKPLPATPLNPKTDSIQNNNNNSRSNFGNTESFEFSSPHLKQKQTTPSNNNNNNNIKNDNFSISNGNNFNNNSSSSKNNNNSSGSGNESNKNKKSNLLLEEDNEFDDFVEIQEKNIEPICQQYYIPFYQSSEMCSNEAKKWLEDQWFLPANFKDIQWSKPNRFYFPVYVFSLTTTTFFDATFTVNDFTNTISKQKITSNHDEIIFCASNSFDSTLVDKLIKKNTYSNRSTHYLPSSDELQVYNSNTILNEKVLTIDISKSEIWTRCVFPYIQEKEKKKCIEFIQKKYNVKNVDLNMNDPMVDSEQYLLVYLPISSETYQYSDKLYDTLTSGNKGKTVGNRPIGTGLSVGGTLYDAVSNLTTLVHDSVGM